MAFELRVKNWRSYLPILDVVRDYQRADFPHDLIAGLIVGMITVPQAIAYAFLAGLPPQAGLYACLAPMVIYAILGSSKHLVVGPVAVAALMVAAAVGEHAPAYSDAYLGITTILCLQCGIILWLLRVSNMGGVVNLLQPPGDHRLRQCSRPSDHHQPARPADRHRQRCRSESGAAPAAARGQPRSDLNPTALDDRACQCSADVAGDPAAGAFPASVRHQHSSAITL